MKSSGSEQGIVLLLGKTVTLTQRFDVGCATIHRRTGLRAVLIVVVDGAQVKRCAPYLAGGPSEFGYDQEYRRLDLGDHIFKCAGFDPSRWNLAIW